MLKTLLTILLLCSTALAHQPVVTHPYLKPDLTAPVAASVPLPPVDADKAKQDHAPKKGELDKPFWALSALLAASAVADLTTTSKAIDRGGVEANPLFAGKGKGALIATNVAFTVAGWALAAWFQKLGWKRAARIGLGFGAAIRFGAAIHNHRVLR